MSKHKQIENRPLYVAIGLAICAFIVALPPLFLWLVISLDILGYALLAGFIAIFVVSAWANLGQRKSSVFYANNPIGWISGNSEPGAEHFSGNNDVSRITGWRAAYSLDYMGVLTRLKTRGGKCSVCSRHITLSNLGTVHRHQGKPVIVCSRGDCLEIASKRAQENEFYP